MESKIQIAVRAFVAASEADGVRRAVALLTESLSESGASVAMQLDLVDSLADIGNEQSSILIASLLPELSDWQEPWLQTNQRLRKTYERLGELGAPILICTILRHIPAHEDEHVDGRMKRLRQLNLLAAELSREFGVLVIDLDRTLADIGARSLGTDYRLMGIYAAEAVGKQIALAVISGGLDNFVSFEIQDAAKEIVAAHSLQLPTAAVTEVAPSNLLALGKGRRRQIVKTVVDAQTESHAGWLVGLLFAGKLTPGEAIVKLKASVAKRGMKASVALAIAAAGHALQGRTRIDR